MLTAALAYLSLILFLLFVFVLAGVVLVGLVMWAAEALNAWIERRISGRLLF